jgi:hypothetical protein
MGLKTFLHKFKYKVAGEENPCMDQQGMIMVLVLMLLLLFTAMGILLMYMVASTIKSSGLLKTEETRFYGADGGVLAVTAYLTQYHRTDAPADITSSTNYQATITYLGQTITYPIGYSTLWKGANVKINSVSPPTNSTAEIEAVVFIPVAPAGYGNE